MSQLLYKLTCLTNLHMGSGDTNYDIIDLEVERDPVLQEPTMNASGVKGALRDFCEAQRQDSDVEYIFGSRGSGDKQGNYRFFSGDLLARPVRVSGGEPSFLLATTPDLLQHVLTKLHAFSLQKDLALADIPALPKGKAISSSNVSEVEGILVEHRECALLDRLLGAGKWVLMSASHLKDIDLPVMAHNVLENGISKNLWYEQVVPHESVFLLVIGAPDEGKKLDAFLKDGSVVQFGAGATTGSGYTLMTKLEG